MFYVYEWYDTETKVIFYVGKGCGDRYKSTSHRNNLFLNYTKEHACSVRIVKRFAKEEDAFAYENQYILELKERGMAFCNLDNGGAGSPQFIWTKEMREYKSMYNPMKEESQRQRMTNNNPMKKKEIVEKVAKTKRMAVIINGTRYKSVHEAAKQFGVKDGTVIKWCKKGINNYFQQCRYEARDQVQYDGNRYNKGGCKPIVYKGTQYESAIDLSRELGLDHSTVAKWAKRGFDPNGNECAYIDDKEKHTFKPYVNGEAVRKPIKVNGVIYESKAEAERQLGLCKGYLAAYISGKRKNDKYICEYINPQTGCDRVDQDK